MLDAVTFDQVLDAVEHLPEEQQADLVEVVRHRIAERGRQRIIADARDARAEHAAGKTRAMSPMNQGEEVILLVSVGTHAEIY